MNYLLDTYAVSDWMKPRPDPGLIEWLDSVDEDRTYLSVITLGELRRGVERLPDSARRERLAQWLTDELLDRFAGRVLGVDEVVAQAWGRLSARIEKLGRPVDPIDGLLAATAESHRMGLVTRNVKDFQNTGVPLICPWDD